MLSTLLTIGSGCALGAFVFSLKLGDRRRSRSTFALFVAMLLLLLYSLYPAYEGLLGALAIVAAGVYAFLALRRPAIDDDGSSSESGKDE